MVKGHDMRIAPHHVVGTPQHRLSRMLQTDQVYHPRRAWPEDCTVQWGHGIIPATPFFEAFIPGTFIRGEGETIADAEDRAFERYESEKTCVHLWGRQRPGGQLYTNGAGWCRKCGAFRSEMFPVIVKLGAHRRPLRRMEVDHLRSIETDHEMNAHMDARYPERREDRLRHGRLLRIRMNLYGAVAQD